MVEVDQKAVIGTGELVELDGFKHHVDDIPFEELITRVQRPAVLDHNDLTAIKLDSTNVTLGQGIFYREENDIILVPLNRELFSSGETSIDLSLRTGRTYFEIARSQLAFRHDGASLAEPGEVYVVREEQIHKLCEEPTEEEKAEMSPEEQKKHEQLRQNHIEDARYTYLHSSISNIAFVANDRESISLRELVKSTLERINGLGFEKVIIPDFESNRISIFNDPQGKEITQYANDIVAGVKDFIESTPERDIKEIKLLAYDGRTLIFMEEALDEMRQALSQRIEETPALAAA